MKILALGGCGQQGSLAVSKLIGAADVDEVVVADINIEAARAFEKRIDSRKIKILQLDITNEPALLKAMHDVDVVANFVGPFFRFAEPVVNAAIKSKTNYVDICDDAAPTLHLLDHYQEAARDASVTILLGMGASPGVANMIVRKLADQNDSIDEAAIHWSVSANDIDSDLSADLSNVAIYEHAIELIAANAVQFLDGHYTDLEGGTDLEEVTFRNLGPQSVYYVSHPEPVTIPRYIQLNKVVNKGCVPGLDEVLFALRDFALTSHDLVVVKGVEMQAVDLGVAILARLDQVSDPIPESELPVCSDIFVVVAGTRAAQKRVTRVDIVTSEGLPRMDHITGSGAAVGILMMGRGQIVDRGVYAPEGCVSPTTFFTELEGFGIFLDESEIA